MIQCKFIKGFNYKKNNSKSNLNQLTPIHNKWYRKLNNWNKN